MTDTLVPLASDAAALVPAGAIGPAELYIASLPAVSSRRTAAEALRRITRVLTGQTDLDAWRAVPWERLGAKETTLIRAALLEQKHAPSTLRMTLSILKGVLRQAWRLGLMDAERLARAIDWKPIRGKRVGKAGRMLSVEEVDKLVRHVNAIPPPLGTMLGALFAVGLGGGLRREEIATLSATALQDDGKLLVHGKGNKERLQPVPAWVIARLRSWNTMRARLDLQCGRLFIRNPKRDVPFTPVGVWETVVAVGRAAGVARFTTHDLRRTFASRMLDKGDLSIAQTLMGHEYATTTVLYDRRDAKVAEEAVAGLEGWGFENWEEQEMPKRVIIDVEPEDKSLKATLGEIAGPTLTKAPVVIHETTGQPLVDRKVTQEMRRRVIRVPDFLRDGKAADVGVLRTLALQLESKGRSVRAITAAMKAVKVTRGDGSPIGEDDVKRWLA